MPWFSSQQQPPIFIQTGEAIRFVEVDYKTCQSISLAVEMGVYQPKNTKMIEVISSGYFTTLQDAGRPGLDNLVFHCLGQMDKKPMIWHWRCYLLKETVVFLNVH